VTVQLAYIIRQDYFKTEGGIKPLSLSAAAWRNFFLAMADTEETPILKVQAQCKRWKWCRWLAIS